MFWIPRVFEDVPLRNAQVFQQLPGCMRELRYFHTTQLFGKIRKCLVRRDMGLAAFQQIENMRAQRLSTDLRACNLGCVTHRLRLGEIRVGI